MLYKLAIPFRYQIIYLLSFIALLGFITPDLSYSQARISGKVIDSTTNEPLSNANVILKGTLKGASSDTKGNFVINNVKAGIYTIEASFAGYESSKTEDLVVENLSNIVLVFKLNEKTHSLREVVITPGHYSFMKGSPGSKVSFTRENVKATALFGGDISRSVARLPGVIGSDYSAKFTIRGGESDEILVMFDGLELYDPFHQQDAGGVLSIIDTEAIGGVDLLTGGFSAEYGRKKSGVFSINSETGELDKKRTTFGLSFMNARFLTEMPIQGDKGRWLLSARRGLMDYALQIANTEEKIMPKYYDILGKLEYELNINHSFSAHILRSGDKFTFTDNDNDDSRSSYGNTYGWINWRSFFTDELFAETVLSTGKIEHDRFGRSVEFVNDSTIIPLYIDDKRDFTFLGIKQDWGWELWDNLFLKWGLEYKNFDANYEYSSIRQDLTNPSLEVFEVDTVEASLKPTGSEQSAYLSARIKIIEPLTIEIGGRYDNQSYIKNNEKWSPRANLAFAVFKNTAFKAGWGQFYQTQGIHELEIQDGDTNFYPSEMAEHLVMGIEQTFPGGIKARLEGYQKKLNDYRPRFKNVFNTIDIFEEFSGNRLPYIPDGGESKGLELLLKKDRIGRYTWWGSYSISKAEDHFLHQRVYKAFDQTHSIDFNLNFRPRDDIRVNASWVYHTGWPYTEAELITVSIPMKDNQHFYEAKEMHSSRLNPYHRLDVRITKYVELQKGKFEWFVEIINMYDRKNVRTREFSISNSGEYPNSPPAIVVNEHYWLRFMPTVGIAWEF